VSEWVREILEVFESEGLRAARAFMEDTDNIFFQRLRGHGILSFDQIAPKLLPYTRGLAKRSIMLGSADHAGTDTSTIFLPHEISIFPTEKQNFLLYKFIATFQWALITNDCYCHTSENYSAMREALSKYYNRIPDSPNEVVLEFFFNCFPEKPLAEDIYSLLYSIKAAGFLREYVPGLMRDAQFIFEHIMAQRFSGRKSKPVGVLEDIAHWLLLYCMGRKKTVNFTDEIAEVLSTVHSPHSSSLDIMDSTHKVYELCVAEENRTVFIPFIFQGKLRVNYYIETLSSF